MNVDLNQLPIPDWGLECPGCRYPLRGLPSHRCPECGAELDIPSLVGPWTRLRDPWYHGDESPLPDFGLACATCDTELAGASRNACPNCGETFDLQALRPRASWFLIDARFCGSVALPALQVLLTTELVPHIPVEERTVREIYGGHNAFFTRLRVPSEFYFDVLALLQQARRDIEAAHQRGAAGDWVCTQCREENPGNFDLCWNCGQSHAPETDDEDDRQFDSSR